MESKVIDIWSPTSAPDDDGLLASSATRESFRERMMALALEHEAVLQQFDQLRGSLHVSAPFDAIHELDPRHVEPVLSPELIQAAAQAGLQILSQRDAGVEIGILEPYEQQLHEQHLDKQKLDEQHLDEQQPDEYDKFNEGARRPSKDRPILRAGSSHTLTSKAFSFHVREPGNGLATRKLSHATHKAQVIEQSLEDRAPSWFHTLVQHCGLRTFLRRVESSTAFEGVCIFIIILNTVTMTVSTELVARNATVETALVIARLEQAYCLFYIGELVIRLLAQRLEFFHGTGAGWRWFDLFLVIMAFNEQLSSLGLYESETSGSTVFRLARLFKVLKVLRVIRILRSLNELRMILDSIVSSVKAMFWVIILIGVVTFMFSMCFVQAMSQAMREEPDLRESTHWANVPTGMLNLLSLGTGGEDWMEVYLELQAQSNAYSVLFVLYIIFFQFVVQNTVTSIFVDALFQDKSENELLVMEERMRDKQKYVSMIVKMFEKMESDAGTGVTKDMLMSRVKDRDLQNFASNLDIREVDLEIFFDVLTCHGSRPVDLETFVVGCIKLRGAAKSVDMVELSRKFGDFSKDHQSFSTLCHEHFNDQQAEFDKFKREHKDFTKHCTKHFSHHNKLLGTIARSP